MIGQSIEAIRQAGFSLELEDGKVSIRPFSHLNEKQLAWLKDHKAAIIDYLKAERVTVHVPEFELQSGKRVSFDLDVPRINLPKLRKSLRFELIENQGGGSILGSPGQTESELHERLMQKYGTRLAYINEQAIH